MNKEKLDALILDYWVQPIGNAYDSLLVYFLKEEEFLEQIYKAGFTVSKISFYEYRRWRKPKVLQDDNLIKSKYFSGYFSKKLYASLDDFNPQDNHDTIFEKVNAIRNEFFETLDVCDRYEALGTDNPNDDIRVLKLKEENLDEPYIELWLSFKIDVPKDWVNAKKSIEAFSNYIGGIYSVFYDWDPIGMFKFYEVPETEYDTEIDLIIAKLKKGKTGIVYKTMQEYFGRIYEFTKQDCLSIEAKIKKIIDEYEEAVEKD